MVCIPYRRERDVNVKREFMTYDRVTRAWNRSLHVVSFQVHAQHSRARNKKRSPLSMREAMEKLIESITNVFYCMNSLLNSTGTQTLKTGVAEYSWLTQHLWVHFKSINFSCKTMLILVHVVFASTLMAVLVLLQKLTFLKLLQMTLHSIVMHVYMYILYKAITWLRT